MEGFPIGVFVFLLALSAFVGALFSASRTEEVIERACIYEQVFTANGHKFTCELVKEPK